MRILLIADGRSPTTRRWVKAVGALGHEIILVSTFRCAPVEGVEADVCLPVAFSTLSGSGAGAGNASSKPSAMRKIVASFRGPLLGARYLFGPVTLQYYGPRLRWLIERIQPDLVHALRIPFEGMLGAWTPARYPLAVSIWGNDLTLHAAGSHVMAALTRKTLARADALLADTRRDIRLARAWGLASDKPTQVLPGSGGLDLEEIQAVRAKVDRWGSSFDVQFDPAAPLVINPRGFRTGSVRQDTFFEALPLVLERNPRIQFACAAMAGQREAMGWIEKLKLQNKVTLLPHLPQAELWELFARAAVTVSVSQHDGTPNTLLEAIALGAFPIVGDIESLREWITPGYNGLLVEPTKPQELAEAILLAVDNAELRRRAAGCNAALVNERAALESTKEKLRLFYEVVGAMKDIPA